MSGAREPTDTEFHNMLNLQDIFTWSKLQGAIDYSPSQVGSLLGILGADEDTSIDELAAISPARFITARVGVDAFREQ